MAAEKNDLCLDYVLPLVIDCKHYDRVCANMIKTYKKPMQHPVTQLEPNLLVDPGLNGDTGESILTKNLADVANLEKDVQDVPPDGGYGWVCVACVFMVNAHTWGLNSV
ncbi:MAG: hypothetical protein Q9187_006849 [Circinaria calcarea]